MIPLTKSNGRKLFVLRRISTGQVLNPRVEWPNADENAPIQGLDPDLEYLPIFTASAPDYDPAHYTLQQSEGENLTEHRWEIHYETPERPKEEVKNIAANAERLQVRTLVPAEDFTRNTVLLLAAILRKAEGISLTDDERAACDDMVAKAALLKRNKDTLDQIKAEIDAGDKPSIDAIPWATAAP